MLYNIKHTLYSYMPLCCFVVIFFLFFQGLWRSMRISSFFLEEICLFVKLLEESNCNYLAFLSVPESMQDCISHHISQMVPFLSCMDKNSSSITMTIKVLEMLYFWMIGIQQYVSDIYGMWNIYLEYVWNIIYIYRICTIHLSKKLGTTLFH